MANLCPQVAAPSVLRGNALRHKAGVRNDPGGRGGTPPHKPKGLTPATSKRLAHAGMPAVTPALPQACL